MPGEEDWEEELERRLEELEEKIERMTELLSERLTKSIEKMASKAARIAVETPKAGIMIKAAPGEVIVHRPIPIRRLDRRLYERIRDLARERGVTVGEVMNEAMRFYLLHHDLAELEEERKRILQKLEEVGIPGAIEDPEIRDLLRKEYVSMLEEVKKRIAELRAKLKEEEEGE
ncbi:MAG TPA: hypothetical protein ENG69_02430 [Candidatus Korarchaeota archaeon]|nr:hypothetical protein [Candidatus Korarchaeota archaeon]